MKIKLNQVYKAVCVGLGFSLITVSMPAQAVESPENIAQITSVNSNPSCEPRTPDDAEEFQAVLDRMPPGEPTLRVTGTVTAPNPGYEVELVPAGTTEATQGRVLALQVVQEPGEGVFPQVIATCPVEYEKSGSELVQLDEVVILQTGQEPIRVPIEEVF